MKTFIFLIIITLVLFALLIVAVIKNQNELDEENPVFSAACAGSVNAGAPSSIRVENFHWDKLIKSDGNKPIERADNVLFFMTIGNSMLLGGIKDKDLLVVKKTKGNECDFPAIVVLKRDKKRKLKAAKENDFAEYKVRRTWDECSLEIGDDAMVSRIRKILEDERFKQLKRNYPDKFPEDEELICDFRNRLEQYRNEYQKRKDCSDVILSTTLSTKTQTVHFSIHPKCSMVGKVEHAFQICNLAS